MKVRYTLPLRGMLRLSDPSPLNFDGLLFQFKVDESSGYVAELIIEINNVPKEKWPTLSKAKRTHTDSGIPIFPFEVNRDALRFADMEPYVLNLESYLSVFGLEEIELNKLQEEWLPEGGTEFTSMQSSFALRPGKQTLSIDPISPEWLARCIVAARQSGWDTAALAHFRVGQAHFIHQRYMEAIRSLYLCLEGVFVRPSHDHLREFAGSKKLTAVVSDMFFQHRHESFEKIKARHATLSTGKGPEDFFRFLIGLRGEIQHTNLNKRPKWHPSKQHDLMDEAICLMDVAERVCFDMMETRLRNVPVSR